MLSVIIATQNNEKEIPFLLNNLKQTNKNLDVEFIFIDYKSKDATLEFIRNFSREMDDFFTIKILESLFEPSIPERWNEAIKYSTGHYLTFLSPKDSLHMQGWNSVASIVDSSSTIKGPDLFVSQFIILESHSRMPTSHSYMKVDYPLHYEYPLGKELTKIYPTIGRMWINRNLLLKCMFCENTLVSEETSIALWFGMSHQIRYIKTETYQKVIWPHIEDKFHSPDFLFIQFSKAMDYIIWYFEDHIKDLYDLTYVISVISQITTQFILWSLRGKCPEEYPEKFKKYLNELILMKGDDKPLTIRNKILFKLYKFGVFKPLIKLIAWIKGE